MTIATIALHERGSNATLDASVVMESGVAPLLDVTEVFSDVKGHLVVALESIGKLVAKAQDTWARSVGLSMSQLSILMAIDLLGEAGGVSQVDVAKHLGVHASYITSQSKQLERSGFIRRDSCADDRRVVLLSLTKRASEAARAVKPHQASFHRLVFDEFFDDELLVLLKACRNLEKRLVNAPHVVARDG
ncbi:MarR family winged helix-turn-helix transcriptional regulator [Tardiphaga sp. P5_C7]